jgi:hypothetical protein
MAKGTCRRGRKTKREMTRNNQSLKRFFMTWAAGPEMRFRSKDSRLRFIEVFGSLMLAPVAYRSYLEKGRGCVVLEEMWLEEMGGLAIPWYAVLGVDRLFEEAAQLRAWACEYDPESEFLVCWLLRDSRAPQSGIVAIIPGRHGFADEPELAKSCNEAGQYLGLSGERWALERLEALQSEALLAEALGDDWQFAADDHASGDSA